MILLYYLDSNEQLQKCHEQIAEDIDRTDREVSTCHYGIDLAH